MSVGPGYHSVMGTYIETIVKEGDIVILPQMGPSKMDFEGEEYYMIEENKILLLIHKLDQINALFKDLYLIQF